MQTRKTFERFDLTSDLQPADASVIRMMAQTMRRSPTRRCPVYVVPISNEGMMQEHGARCAMYLQGMAVERARMVDGEEVDMASLLFGFDTNYIPVPTNTVIVGFFIAERMFYSVNVSPPRRETVESITLDLSEFVISLYVPHERLEVPA